MSLLIYKFNVMQFSFLSLSYLCCCSGVAGQLVHARENRHQVTSAGKLSPPGAKRGKHTSWCQARQNMHLVSNAGKLLPPGAKRGKRATDDKRGNMQPYVSCSATQKSHAIG